MRRLSALTWAAAAALVLGLTTAAPASASETDEFSDIEGDPYTGLVYEPAEGEAVSARGTNFSPAGCAGQTDYAHKSFNEASVHGRTTCTVAVGSLGVTTILQKQGWLYWESQLNDSSSRTNSKNSQDAHPHWYCGGWGSQNYRGVSTHWSQEASGRYSATTVGMEKRFSC
ncbi:hypothetical protein [Microbacterium sp. NPDC089695]|uniref:hypothetical protein n=1 Tax=Microbacterium sp. NPDC089695 TaxID=3364198 RepID=UPI0037FFD19C